MTRHCFFAIVLAVTGILIAPAKAATPLQCEDRAVNCEARCTDVTGGAGDVNGHLNTCHQYCAQRVSICLSNSFIHSNASIRPYRIRWWDQ
jgi:hypothetical protein